MRVDKILPVLFNKTTSLQVHKLVELLQFGAWTDYMFDLFVDVHGVPLFPTQLESSAITIIPLLLRALIDVDCHIVFTSVFQILAERLVEHTGSIFALLLLLFLMRVGIAPRPNTSPPRPFGTHS